MVKLTSGGGINSNKVVQSKKGQKDEPVTHKANVDAVAQQGMAVQFKKEPLTEGRGYEPKAMGPTGVPGKYNASTQGPGSGRTIHPTGSQSQYGPVAQGSVNRAPDVPATTPGRDILSDYGPERRGR
jgi:hypothetical protein